jgi:hypothetical protein
VWRVRVHVTVDGSELRVLKGVDGAEFEGGEWRFSKQIKTFL